MCATCTEAKEEWDSPGKRCSSYGDGSPLEPAVLDEIRRVFERACVKLPWQEGDVLLVDNTRVAHGRSPFTGPRKVVLVMGGLVRLSDVEIVTN